MTSEILSYIQKPATAVITAVAMHPGPDDFCKEIALRSLNDFDIVATGIVTLTQSAELQTLGSYGPKTVLDSLNGLTDKVELAIREKNRVSLQLVSLERDKHGAASLALVPTTPMTSSSGVIAIFFSTSKDNSVFEINTQISLAFACEMYCSPNWVPPVASSLRAKRNSPNSLKENSLTSRQKSVLEHIADGKTNDRIARILNYSVATVKNDISAIFQYLGVTNRQDAIVEAQSRLLLPPPPPKYRYDRLNAS